MLKNKDLNNTIIALSRILVPQSGPCDTIEGELLRALSRIIYRAYNDGDLPTKGYGVEVIGSSLAFLQSCQLHCGNYEIQKTAHSFEENIEHLSLSSNKSYEEYEKAITPLAEAIVNYVTEKIAQKMKESYKSSTPESNSNSKYYQTIALERWENNPDWNEEYDD